MFPDGSDYFEMTNFAKNLPFYHSDDTFKGGSGKKPKNKKAIAKRKAEKKNRKQARKRK